MGERRGAVLPLVLLILSAATVLAWSALDRAVTVDRLSRRMTDREGARTNAAAAITRILLTWDGAGLLSALPPEGAITLPETPPVGGLRWSRPHPLVLVLEGDAPRQVHELLAIELPDWPLMWNGATGVVVRPDSLSWEHRIAGVRDRLRPWRPSHGAMSPDPPWTPVLLSAAVRPPAVRHSGILVVDGTLELTGDWEVNGLLVVLGALHDRGGRLLVRGGLVGDSLRFSGLAAGLRVEPDRAHVERALALVGSPTRAPFHLRLPRP
jgi:hypothetical protein